MEKEMIIASGNKGKIKEVEEILNNYKVIPLKETGIDIDVEEDKETFEENAIKKATEISRKLGGMPCISDDSGIEIDYLNGFPGVFTKRWHCGTDRDRNIEIIKKLNGVKKENRKAKFTTAIAFAEGNKVYSAVATINGYISESVRGDNGFGFDEIFELENGKTLAEITSEEKNKISARKKALEVIKNKLEND